MSTLARPWPGFYTGFLGRAGSTGEINSWVTLMLQGASDEAVAAERERELPAVWAKASKRGPRKRLGG